MKQPDVGMSDVDPTAKALEVGPLRLGISQCLLGEAVRFDGGHKRDRFLKDVLSRYVEWVPVCPEVEAGFGVPREPIRLVRSVGQPRIMTVKTATDHTATMQRFSTQRIRELAALNLCGYVFKSNSPSCGMERVRVYSTHGMPTRNGIGIFARAFMAHFPLTPVEEEGRLNDPAIREHFIERIFCYRRWQNLISSSVRRRELIGFHTRHKLLLLSHDRERYQSLGQLVAHADAHPIHALVDQYGTEFMQALRRRSTVRKQVDVLHHIAGYFKHRLDKEGKRELRQVIEEYHRGLVPLIAPLTLVNHYVRLFEVEYLQQQIYLNPHPKELMLRNHVSRMD